MAKSRFNPNAISRLRSAAAESYTTWHFKSLRPGAKVVLSPPCPQSGIPRITRYPKIVSGCCQDRPEWEHKKTGLFSAGMLRRLLHHGTVVNIRGQSYRLKEKLKGGLLESGEPTDQRISRRQKQPSD